MFDNLKLLKKIIILLESKNYVCGFLNEHKLTKVECSAYIKYHHNKLKLRHI